MCPANLHIFEVDKYHSSFEYDKPKSLHMLLPVVVLRQLIPNPSKSI